MKRGAKRAATSDPGAFAAADLPSKRVMDRPSFDVHRAESSHQHVMAGPASLDTQRAEAASKHVRALNTQFASWVQSQLQDHPAELWVDGVKDYISHASEIMEKFKDVVDWLRKNKVGSCIVSKPSSLKDEKTSSGVSSTHSLLKAEKAAPDAVSTPSSPKDEENTVSVTKGSKVMVQPNTNGGLTSPTTAFSSSAFQKSSSQNIFSFSSGQKMPAFIGIFGDNKNMPGDSNKSALHFGLNNGCSPPNVPAIVSVTSSQSPALFPVSQQPVFPGNQNTAEAPCDGDEDAEPEQPSSPSVKKTVEKGVVVVHEAKCKVYVKHDDATKGWKDIGVGQLSIRSKEGAVKASKESMPTIVIRNDVGKILLNALIYKGIKMNIQKNTVASIFHTSGGGQSCDSGSGTVVARTYLFRLKNEAAASELAAAIKENAPSD